MSGNAAPVICVVIARTRHKMMQAEIQQAAKHGAKLIELRLDFLAKPPDFKRLLANKPCPMIATVRRPADGGRFTGSEEERLVLLRQAIVAGFDWVDLETDIIDEMPRFGKVKRIVSYHNLREVPGRSGRNLQAHVRAGCRHRQAGRDRPASHRQSARLHVTSKNPPKPTIAHCMGDMGVCSRVLSAKFGSPFTYGAFNKERTIAPGILSFAELQEDLPLRRDQRRHARFTASSAIRWATASARCCTTMRFSITASTRSICRSGCRAATWPTFFKEFDTCRCAATASRCRTRKKRPSSRRLEGRSGRADGGGQHADSFAGRLASVQHRRPGRARIAAGELAAAGRR